jgi:putative transposase
LRRQRVANANGDCLASIFRISNGSTLLSERENRETTLSKQGASACRLAEPPLVDFADAGDLAVFIHEQPLGRGLVQKPRGRLWLNDGSCIRLRPQHCNHVWSYDFVEAQIHDGRKLRLMTLIDEFTRECLAIRVARRINSFGVIETMADAMLERGVPENIRSDNGAEMTAKIVRSWLAKLGTKTLYIEPGSPWENGYCESFNGKLHDECLNGEIFYSLKEATVVIEQWRNQYKHDPSR